MKVIDLINMIKNGENMPLKIKVDGDIYKWDTLEFFYSKDNGNDLLELSKKYNTGELLNMSVELLENEINIQDIKEIDIGYVSNIDGMANERTKDKFNEIIRVIKQLDNKIKEKQC